VKVKRISSWRIDGKNGWQYVDSRIWC
jgi:hypothetical protein